MWDSKWRFCAGLVGVTDLVVFFILFFVDEVNPNPDTSYHWYELVTGLFALFSINATLLLDVLLILHTAILNDDREAAKNIAKMWIAGRVFFFLPIVSLLPVLVNKLITVWCIVGMVPMPIIVCLFIVELGQLPDTTEYIRLVKTPRGSRMDV